MIGIPGWLTFGVLIRDFLIVFFAYLLYTRINVKRFPPSAAGKASTMLQAITLGSTIAANAFTPRLALLSTVLFRLSLLATLYSGWGYMRRGRAPPRCRAASAGRLMLDLTTRGEGKYRPPPLVVAGSRRALRKPGNRLHSSIGRAADS